VMICLQALEAEVRNQRSEIREQKSEIREQKEELESQKKTIAALQNQIEELKTAVNNRVQEKKNLSVHRVVYDIVDDLSTQRVDLSTNSTERREQ